MDWRTLAVVLAGILAVWAILIGLLWIFRPSDVGLAALLRIIPDVVRLVRRLLGDRAVPIGPKLALVVLLVWLLSPIDLIRSSSRSWDRSTTWSSRCSCCATSVAGSGSRDFGADGRALPTGSPC